MKHAPLALIISALLLAAGCNRSDSEADAKPADGSTASATAEDGKDDKADDVDSAWDEKVQAYIKIGNRLRGFTGTSNATFAEWRARDAEKVKAGDFKEIRTDSHYFDDSDIENLKKTLAMPGKTPELDQASNALLAAVDKGLPVWNELQEYNKAKRYEDDGGAKGKELLPRYMEGIAAIEGAADTLAAQVDAAAKIAHTKAVAKYKKEGKLLEMHTWEAMGAAEKVVDLFNESDDFKDQTRITQANEQIATLESNVTAMRAEHVKRKAQKDSLPMIDRYDSVADELTEFAGQYREARKDPNKFNDAVSTYNDAVDALNMMAR